MALSNWYTLQCIFFKFYKFEKSFKSIKLILSQRCEREKKVKNATLPLSMLYTLLSHHAVVIATAAAAIAVAVVAQEEEEDICSGITVGDHWYK